MINFFFEHYFLIKYNIRTLGVLPVYKVVKAVPVIVLDGDVPKEPRNSKQFDNYSNDMNDWRRK